MSFLDTDFYQHIEAWTKLSPICRWLIEMKFIKWKHIDFGYIFPEVCPRLISNKSINQNGLL